MKGGDDMPFGVEEYITLGAGGISFLTIIYFVHFFMTKLRTDIDELKEDTRVNREHVEALVEGSKDMQKVTMQQIEKISGSYNNVLDEIKDSNNNIAKSLELLSRYQETHVRLLEKQEERTTKIEIELTKINERIKER